jgi:hypothetical protein
MILGTDALLGIYYRGGIVDLGRTATYSQKEAREQTAQS